MSVAPQRVNDQSQRAASLAARYASQKQAAEWYNVSERTIRRAIADGKLPAVRVGRQIRIKVSDLEALAAPIPTAS